MAKYLLVYRGGTMPETPEEQQRAMAAWGVWYEGMGAGVVDPGNPTGRSATVVAGGSASDGAKSSISGYTIISADSFDLAAKHAAGCPILDDGGEVEVHETIEMM